MVVFGKIWNILEQNLLFEHKIVNTPADLPFVAPKNNIDEEGTADYAVVVVQDITERKLAEEVAFPGKPFSPAMLARKVREVLDR